MGVVSFILLNKEVKNLYLNSFCFGFRLNNFKTIIPEFAKFYFRCQSFKKQLARIAQGLSRYNLSKKYFLEIQINIPTNIKEQSAIADILMKADQGIELLKRKKYLFNNLIIGKNRVLEFQKNNSK